MENGEGTPPAGQGRVVPAELMFRFRVARRGLVALHVCWGGSLDGVARIGPDIVRLDYSIAMLVC